MQEMLLVDIWRIHNPTTQRYSWFRGVNKASRLDFALVDQGVANKTANCTYTTGILSDHSAFYIVVDLIGESRGSGYWKLNTSHLLLQDFVEQMNKIIDKCLVATTILPVKKRWEILKRDVSSFAKEYGKNRSSDTQLIVAQLLEKVTEMEAEISSKEKTDQYYQILENTKMELNEFALERIKGVMFRTKLKWHQYAEKSSKYFYSLEKTKYNAKTCNALYNQEGVLVRSTKKY